VIGVQPRTEDIAEVCRRFIRGLVDLNIQLQSTSVDDGSEGGWWNNPKNKFVRDLFHPIKQKEVRSSNADVQFCVIEPSQAIIEVQFFKTEERQHLEVFVWIIDV